MEEQEATPSNCGKPLKRLLPSQPGNGLVAKRKKLGYGKKVNDDTMGNPQPSPKAPSAMDAVQRLNVGGRRKTHKIESGPTETWLQRGFESGCIPVSRRALRDLSNEIGWPAGLLQLSILVVFVLRGI
jgi:hypothetical protein